MTNFQMAVSQPPFEIRLDTTTRLKDEAFSYLFRVFSNENIHMALRCSRFKTLQRNIFSGNVQCYQDSAWLLPTGCDLVKPRIKAQNSGRLVIVYLFKLQLVVTTRLKDNA